MKIKEIKQIKLTFYLIASVLLTLGLSIACQNILAAWTAPTASPPSGNVSLPINQGSLDQAKIGGLGIGGSFTVAGNAAFSGKVGINTTTPSSATLVVNGTIESSSGGIKFPDGTTQTTAAGGIFTQIDYTSTSYTHYTDASNPPYTNGIYVSDDDIVNTYIQRFTYIAIDFGAGNEKIVYRLMLYILNSYARDNLRQGTFKGSNNSTNGIDGNWTTLTTLASLTWPAGWDKVDFVNITPYRWYKIDGTPNSNNTVLMEWALEGDSAGASYASQWLNGANGAIYYFGGNVGINTTTPSGAKLVVNGTISASTPVNDSDVTTKAWVLANAGGVTWKGYTASTYTGGNTGGLKGMNNKCDTNYSGSHACTYDEIVRLGTNYPWSSTAWAHDAFITVSNFNGFSFYAKDGYFYTVPGGDNVNCVAWSQSASTARGFIYSTTGGVSVTSCDLAYAIPCCK